MQFELLNKSGAYPCEITVDEDNGRYMIRKEDTSGEVFNSKEELYAWIQSNWEPKDFEVADQFTNMMQSLQRIIH